VLLLLVLSAVTLTALDARAGDGSPLDLLRRGADAALAPLQAAVSAGVRALPGGDDDEDVAALRRENEDLRRQVLGLEGARAQGEQLAGLLRLKDEGSYTTVLAQVIGYGPAAPFEQTVVLDVGTRDGVSEDQTVTSGRGGPDSAVVALLTDPTVTVGARLNTGARSLGLATGSGGGTLEFALVTPTGGAALQVGDAVVTAGSDTFAPGVPVGRIRAVAPPGAGVVPTATLEPYADLGALDLLQVVVDGPAREPRVAVPPS
jgi:rod shape-determining protein MreC